MKIACLQMEVQFADPEENFSRAEQMIKQAMEESPDVLVLPETWNTGFFPKVNLESFCDTDGERVTQTFGRLAAQYRVNLVAGSVSNVRFGNIYNTAMVFDRSGSCVATYDKIHLFSPGEEHKFYTPGNRLCRFTLDGVRCGLIICYDLRFPELTRSLALSGVEVLFVVSQWPQERISHLRSLTTTRAIENQMFVVCCNACGCAGETVYGGNSAVTDPWGEPLALAGSDACILSAECDLSVIQKIRSTINIFADRRPEVYKG